MPKDIWAWYNAKSLLLSLFRFFFLMYNCHLHILLVCYGIDPSSFSCPSHFQARGDNQLQLSAVGWWEKEKGYSRADLKHCWTKQRRAEEKTGRRGAHSEKCWFSPGGCIETGWKPKKASTRGQWPTGYFQGATGNSKETTGGSPKAQRPSRKSKYWGGEGKSWGWESRDWGQAAWLRCRHSWDRGCP